MRDSLRTGQEPQSDPPPATSPWPRAGKVAAVAVGLSMAGLAILFSLVWLVTAAFNSSEVAADGSVTILACLTLGVGLGGPLAWHGFRAIQGKPTTHLITVSPWLLLACFVPTVIVGQIVIAYDLLPALTFPPLHVIAASLPPLAILAYVARSLKSIDPGWREVVVNLSVGAFISTGLALLAEILLFVFIFAVVTLVMALTPDGLAQIEMFLRNTQDPLWLTDPANLQSAVLFPPLLVGLVLVFMILGPMLEEVVKLIGIVLLDYRQPTRAQTFLWAVAAGAGFGLMENLFNTTLALDTWAIVMIFRIGATAMHSLATGVVALGWYSFRREGKPLKLAGAYALGAVTHILWNTLALSLAGVGMLVGGLENEIALALGGGTVLLVLALFVLLFIAVLVSLHVVTRRVEKASAAAELA
ncbi:MAG TPA: PrsW family glutamic-type intramembrane protease [Anaerolineae bacterium]|nr:PrsW family glutamic-type intramembrane protease [Anaerolineae bacterium]